MVDFYIMDEYPYLTTMGKGDPFISLEDKVGESLARELIRLAEYPAVLAESGFAGFVDEYAAVSLQLELSKHGVSYTSLFEVIDARI